MRQAWVGWNVLALIDLGLGGGQGRDDRIGSRGGIWVGCCQLSNQLFVLVQCVALKDQVQRQPSQLSNEHTTGIYLFSSDCAGRIVLAGSAELVCELTSSAS